MSTSKYKLQFHCSDDCVQSGCPSHEMEFVNYHTSCTCEFKVDGRRMFFTDWSHMDTIVKLWVENHSISKFILRTTYSQAYREGFNKAVEECAKIVEATDIYSKFTLIEEIRKINSCSASFNDGRGCIKDKCQWWSDGNCVMQLRKPEGDKL